MLAVKTYDQTYIDACRTRLTAALDALPTDAAGEAALADHMLLALDHYFVHRTRAIEGKDGNPLNEVRMLATSIEQHDGVLTKDRTISYSPETSVLGLAIGDRIRLDEPQLRRLATDYFDEIQRRFT